MEVDDLSTGKKHRAGDVRETAAMHEQIEQRFARLEAASQNTMDKMMQMEKVNERRYQETSEGQARLESMLAVLISAQCPPAPAAAAATSPPDPEVLQQSAETPLPADPTLDDAL